MALIGHWHLNQITGLIALDTSGYGNNGMLEGSMTDADWVLGILGNCLDFDGIDDRVNMGNASPLDQLGNGDFSISFWMKSKDAVPLNNGMLFSKLEDVNNRIELFSNGTNNRLYFVFSRTGAGIWGPFSVGSTVFDTIFNHIVLVIDRTTDKVLLYINKIKDSTEIDISSLSTDVSNTGNVSWGSRYNGTNSYEGLIDEINIFNHALSESEIQYLYNNPSGLSFERMFISFSIKKPKIKFTTIKPNITFEIDP